MSDYSAEAIAAYPDQTPHFWDDDSWAHHADNMRTAFDAGRASMTIRWDEGVEEGRLEAVRAIQALQGPWDPGLSVFAGVAHFSGEKYAGYNLAIEEAIEAIRTGDKP